MKCITPCDETIALTDLCFLINQARENNDSNLIEFLRSLWDNESWESICKKFDTEGSVWFVWWMSGLVNYVNSPVFLEDE